MFEGMENYDYGIEFDSDDDWMNDWEDDGMDGDHDSAMDSIGWGDDDSLAYGCGGEDY